MLHVKERTMAIEKSVTYVGADGADHPLVEGRWYQGFYSGTGKVLAFENTPGVVAYWDGDQFLDAPNGNECEMHSYDYLVDRTEPSHSYTGKDGGLHPLTHGRWYQGFIKDTEGLGLGNDLAGKVSYWDEHRGWLKGPDEGLEGVMLHDYYVEVEIAVRPPKTLQQRFNDAVLAERKDVDATLKVSPELKCANGCATNGALNFKGKQYLRAHVWYLMAASYSLGQPLFAHYEEAADNARTLAFAKFSQGE
jgi:hypothetical protein